MTRDDWRRSWPAWLRAHGDRLSVRHAFRPAARRSRRSCPTRSRRSSSKHPEEFGHGAIEGVAGPEAANNASSTGVLVPLLTLGHPDLGDRGDPARARSRTTACSRGRCCSRRRPTLVWGLIASLYVGNVMLLVLNLPLIGLWVQVLTIPRPLLYGGILVFATLGAYSLHQSVVDLVTLYVVRPARLRDAALGLSGRAGGDRPDPRPAGRTAVPPRARDQPGRSVGVPHAPDLGGTPALTALLLLLPWLLRIARAWRARRR